ncbi:ABC transporter ATP-binding protein [Actinoallomurus iriomotensis]|uniref:ABC transporter ATP-binding protein n=1 Tax=Actinoallomurus iriomotensis TaxID=478107 RepID=A0A9W6W5P0_9ACTN|nr:ABC transporter ATP-binding protein [Actinoallomurus iriomotensis]GLY91192.1 ABC transporter ATP-binding protein [Actinoallomurus iriomotensis]
MSIIATRGLGKQFPGVLALDELTIDIEPGIVGLVGANGAGKSTLIKILLGLIPPTRGQASVLGLDTARESLKIRELVGYMPENDCLPPDVSATEFIVHIARVSGLPATAARERAADTLRHVGLYEERYRPIGGYSTGMRQRVKLAQALVHDPKLVFLDEPTNGLDPAGRDEMLALIQRIGTQFGISVLVTSHLLGELERVAQHLVIIDGGRLLRSQAVTAFTQASGVLAVEVDDEAAGRDRLGNRLAEAGLRVHPDGRGLLIDIADETTYDLVRDCVADLGLALVRMENRRHRIEEVFSS